MPMPVPVPVPVLVPMLVPMPVLAVVARPCHSHGHGR